MSVYKCKMCGGELTIDSIQTVCECEYCGSKQTLPKLNDVKRVNMYDRASHFRRNNDYDKAMSIYEQILNEDGTDAEAYWSVVLCRYGIEYVEEGTGHKRVPTVNRTQLTSILADEDYKSALKYADASQREIYEAEAKAIEEIQKGIIEISNNEEPFDIFICYKESDSNGRRTHDSVYANELYHQLTQEGFKVFYARITLEDKLGTAYEPYIFAALNSAKVMVVIGTKKEYFEAPWVKNEWSRYLSLIKKGAKKVLIPAYKDMDPYELPDEFSHLQAQDMSKLGFMQDLIRGVKKIVGEQQPKSDLEVKERYSPNADNKNINALIKRGNMALEDEEWKDSDTYFEEVLNLDAERAEAYLGKWLGKNKTRNVASLVEKYITYGISRIEERTEYAFEPDEQHIRNIEDKFLIDNYLDEHEIRDFYRYDFSYKSRLQSAILQKENVLNMIESEKLYQRTKQFAVGQIQDVVCNAITEITEGYDKRIEEERKHDEETITLKKQEYENLCQQADVKINKIHGRYIDAIELVRGGEYLGALDEFKKLTEQYPEDYRGWWGMIQAQTRNYTHWESEITDIWFKKVQDLVPQESYQNKEDIYKDYLARISTKKAEIEISKMNDKLKECQNEIENQKEILGGLFLEEKELQEACNLKQKEIRSMIADKQVKMQKEGKKKEIKKAIVTTIGILSFVFGYCLTTIGYNEYSGGLFFGGIAIMLFVVMEVIWFQVKKGKTKQKQFYEENTWKEKRDLEDEYDKIGKACAKKLEKVRYNRTICNKCIKENESKIKECELFLSRNHHEIAESIYESDCQKIKIG